jgi:hypothetical protein
MDAYQGTRQISAQEHEKLCYLDVQHILRVRGSDIQGTVGNLRLHLLEHHGLGTLTTQFNNNLRKLARLHLTAHALGPLMKE